MLKDWCAQDYIALNRFEFEANDLEMTGWNAMVKTKFKNQCFQTA